jgi:hypothetical protein
MRKIFHKNILFFLVVLSSFSAFSQENSQNDELEANLKNSTITISGEEIKYSNHFDFNIDNFIQDGEIKRNKLNISTLTFFNKNLSFDIANSSVNKLNTNTLNKRRPLFENNNGIDLKGIEFDPDITYVISGNIAGGYQKDYYSVILFNDEVKLDNLNKNNNNYKDNTNIEVVNQGSVFINASNEESKVLQVNIYPNPASNFITIESDNEVKSIDVVDTRGRVVKHSVANNQLSQTINIEDLSKGLYLVNVQFLNGEIVQNKIIVID